MSDGTLVLTYGEPNGNSVKMFECTSTDDGVTWSHPRSFASVNKGTLGLQRRPRVQIDKNGTMHAVFEDLRSSTTIHVFHCYSNDGGTTWSMPMRVAPNAMAPHEDFCSAAIDSTNRLVVTFLSMGMGATDEMVHVYLTTTSDNGITWTNPVRVDQFLLGGSCECCQQNVTVSPFGDITVAFRSNINNRRDVFACTSTDNGTTFNTPIAIQSGVWTIDGCPTTGPSLVYDSKGDLHVTWWDERDDANKAIAYYARLANGQTSTPFNVDLSSAIANEAEYPSVATSANGTDVVVSWLSSTGVYVARSINGGNSFIPVNADPYFMNNSSTFSVWLNNGGTLTIWQGIRDGKFDLMQLRDEPTSVSSEFRVESSEFRISNSEFRIPKGVVRGEIFDLLGNLVQAYEHADAFNAFELQGRGVMFVRLTFTDGSVKLLSVCR